jgi:hypothetical protein
VAKKRHRAGRHHAGLRYPRHALSPEDLLHFIEATAFTAAWDRLGLDDEDDLMALQLLIMSQPKAPPVIQGTGGLRKLRFAPVRWNTGVSGAARVCYVYFEEYGIIYLVYVYDKRSKDNLSDAEKKVIRDHIRRQKQALERRRTIY